MEEQNKIIRSRVGLAPSKEAFTRPVIDIDYEHIEEQITLIRERFGKEPSVIILQVDQSLYGSRIFGIPIRVEVVK